MRDFDSLPQLDSTDIACSTSVWLVPHPGTYFQSGQRWGVGKRAEVWLSSPGTWGDGTLLRGWLALAGSPRPGRGAGGVFTSSL